MCIVKTTTVKGCNSTVVIDPRPQAKKDFWSVVPEFEKPFLDRKDLAGWDRDGSMACFRFDDGSVTMVEYLV